MEHLHDLADVFGLVTQKRALEVAAAGGHPIWVCGQDGCGAGLLVQCLPGILPPTSAEEVLIVEQRALSQIEIKVERVPVSEIFHDDFSSSHDVGLKIVACRSRQMSRQGCLNSRLSGRKLIDYARLDKKGRDVLDSAWFATHLVTSDVINIIRIGRTIADLDNCEDMNRIHIAESFMYARRLGVKSPLYAADQVSTPGGPKNEMARP